MLELDPLLAGRVAVVCGAGRGIGEANARVLAAAGAAVTVVDVEADRAEAVAGAIREDGGDAWPATAELRDRGQVEAFVAATRERWGRLDILVNVAGGVAAYARWRALHDWTDEDWDAIVERNLRYVFLTCRAAIPVMLETSDAASIVNVASISGTSSAPNHAAYGAAKAGIVNLTRSLAVEYGPQGLRVNAVAPGSILTPATEGVLTEEMMARTRHTIPLGRRGTPDDIAHTTLFLASPLGAYVTGQTILVDGGASAKFPLTGPPVDTQENG